MQLVFFGDFCACDGKVPPFGKKLKKLINSSDIVSLNLEAPLLMDKTERLSKVGPCIYQPAEVAKILRERGINFINLANNHIMDYGFDGLKQTLNLLNGQYFVGAGLDCKAAYAPLNLKFGVKKIAFLGFSESQFGRSSDGSGGYACIDSPRARLSIVEAKKNADYVFIQVHAGLENIEVPLPEWKDIYRELVDLGADVVIGHHPHVIQGFEIYKNKHIFYSIGNFYMNFLDEKNTTSGMALIIKIEDGLAFDFIELKVKGNAIEMASNSKIFKSNISRLSEKLNSKDYLKDIDQICIRLWKRYYFAYYIDTFSSILDRVINFKFREAIYQVIMHWKGIKNKKYLMVIHNSRIESHRCAIDRAIRKLNKSENNEES